VAKADAQIDLWLQEAAPTAELRRWFGHDPERWIEFRARYFAELRPREAQIRAAVGDLRARQVTFVFAARETRFNNAVALREFLEG
jgi:uncharacterized protein YeaO (DUF488 family)